MASGQTLRTAGLVLCSLAGAASIWAAPARKSPAPRNSEAMAAVSYAGYLPVNPFDSSLRGVDVISSYSAPSSYASAEPGVDMPAPSSVPALRFQARPAAQHKPDRNPFSVESRVRQTADPGVLTVVASVPAGDRILRMGGGHFNTQDGSKPDAFAICYRISDRTSIEVIPGDPAPVKLPVSTVGNNEGVTAGIVFRLGH